MTYLLRTVCLIFAFCLTLSACSDNDAGGAPTPSATAESAPAAAPAASEEGSSMDIEKAEGVVYQDEIYANWPYN